MKHCAFVCGNVQSDLGVGMWLTWDNLSRTLSRKRKGGVYCSHIKLPYLYKVVYRRFTVRFDECSSWLMELGQGRDVNVRINKASPDLFGGVNPTSNNAVFCRTMIGRVRSPKIVAYVQMTTPKSPPTVILILSMKVV